MNSTPLRDVTFLNLMNKRIYRVLIIANPYDAFMLEDDGRIDEKLFNEYTELGLRYPPTFTQVSTTEEARAVLTSVDVNLVICMPGNLDNGVPKTFKEIFWFFWSFVQKKRIPLVFQGGIFFLHFP